MTGGNKMKRSSEQYESDIYKKASAKHQPVRRYSDNDDSNSSSGSESEKSDRNLGNKQVDATLTKVMVEDVVSSWCNSCAR